MEPVDRSVLGASYCSDSFYHSAVATPHHCESVEAAALSCADRQICRIGLLGLRAQAAGLIADHDKFAGIVYYCRLDLSIHTLRARDYAARLHILVLVNTDLDSRTAPHSGWMTRLIYAGTPVADRVYSEFVNVAGAFCSRLVIVVDIAESEQQVGVHGEYHRQEDIHTHDMVYREDLFATVLLEDSLGPVGRNCMAVPELRIRPDCGRPYQLRRNKP